MFVARALPSRPRHSRATCLSTLNRLLTRWAPAGALCAQAARRQHSREKVRGATEDVGTLPGARVVYISGYQSTAAFEVFVNRIPFTIEEHYKAFYLEWPDSLTERFRHEKLPANWRIHPPPIEAREIGDRWVKERRSAVLALPSTVSPADTNFLAQPPASRFQAYPNSVTD